MRLTASLVSSIGTSAMTVTSDANDGVNVKSICVESGPATWSVASSLWKLDSSAKRMSLPVARVNANV